MGVSALIAAGWAIDDQAARCFAKSFYGLVLDGTRFGDAVLAARQVTYRDHSSSTTWGAYQCYGEPDWRLIRRAERAPAGQRTFGLRCRAHY